MSLRSPWQRAILRVIGDAAGYTGLILEPIAQAYVFDLYVPVGKRIKSLHCIISGGTSITAALQKNGVAITGMSGSVVPAGLVLTAPTDGTENVVPGDILSLLCSAPVGSPVDLAFAVIGYYT